MWSFSCDIPVFWVKMLNITTLLWLDFSWKRKKGQNSRSKYGMVQPWWSCKNSGEEAERSWGNVKWNCGESSVGPQALPSALSPQFRRTWVPRLPLGWGQILSEKLHSEDTMFNYIVMQPIDIIWNPQWTPDWKENWICFGDGENGLEVLEVIYVTPLTS